MSETIESKGTETEQGASPAAEEVGQAEAPAPVVPMLPPNVGVHELSEKDIEQLRKVDEQEVELQRKALSLMKGQALILNQISQHEMSKSQIAAALKNKYELADDVAWEANYKDGKLYYQKSVPQAPPVQAQPAKA